MTWMTGRTRGWMRVGAVVAAALLGCQAAPGEDPSPGTFPPDAFAPDTAMPDHTPADMEHHPLTEPQIADVLRALNEGEVMTSQVALQQATNAEVRAFAERMVSEHTAALQRLDALLQRLGITPEPSRLSEVMRMHAQKTVDFLRTRQGNDFDLASMDVQAALHAHGALLGDLLLAPQVQNPELAQELRGLRRTVQDHLRAAADLQGRLLPAP